MVYDSINSDFQLVIRGLTLSDVGHYECQINTIPVKVRVVSVETRTSVTTPAPGDSVDTDEVDTSDLVLGTSSTDIIGAPDIYFIPGSLGTILYYDAFC